MIKSMTGFGKGEGRLKNGRLIVELKTVNHKFYELSSRIPASIMFLEDRIRNHINVRIKRGKVNLNLVVEDGRELDKSININRPLVKRYYDAISGLKKELGAKGEVTMDQLLSMPDVITYTSADIDTEKVWPQIKAALDEALEKLIRSRQAEGAELGRDLLSRIEAIEGLIKDIRKQAPRATARYKKDLQKRIESLAGRVRLDRGRLETEVAIFAKNCDITEEITRVLAHTKSFKALLTKDKDAGRQLDFIAQELFREANTIGSKAQDVGISKNVILVKEQIEKIREQAQNVE
jgi:uncharacterized protein (TIGR00255 family)